MIYLENKRYEQFNDLRQTTFNCPINEKNSNSFEMFCPDILSIFFSFFEPQISRHVHKPMKKGLLQLQFVTLLIIGSLLTSGTKWLRPCGKYDLFGFCQ